jgi:pimeloyl-ACP methyl ester carboxylesterase
MQNGRIVSNGIWAMQGGTGERLLLLLHGLGANASVWNPMFPFIERSWQGRWLAPDFRGHGRSLYEGPYGYGTHAADMAGLIWRERRSTVLVAGHSFGGVVGAMLASGWFGPQIDRLFAIGVKLQWKADEVAKSQELAQKPSPTFAVREQATERYLKTSGLYGLLMPDDEDATFGVKPAGGGYEVRMDPRVFSAVGPSIPAIFSQIAVPFRLAAGSRDPMVAAGQMRQIDKSAVVFEGAGHSVHYEAPERVWQQILSYATSAA